MLRLTGQSPSVSITAMRTKTNDRILPIMGTLPLGIGMMGLFLPTFIYVIEAFGFYSASAIASLYNLLIKTKQI